MRTAMRELVDTMGVTLNDLMEFDHVVRVLPSGAVIDAEADAPCAPELTWWEDSREVELHAQAAPWSLMTGYTGQYGVRGPSMHACESIGNRLEHDILSNPGLYVALVVESITDGEQDSEPAGWAVAFILDAVEQGQAS